MSDRDATYEYELDPDASNNTAASILRLVRETSGPVLDLGSGPGIVAAELARADGRDVTCVDADADLLAAARDRGVERTIVADLERPIWYEKVPSGPYGAIVLADVLEHLRHPEHVLETIRDRGMLADDGCLIISVPNVAHEAVIAGLIGGHFDYTDTGLLDATHIHFFTRDSLHDLLETTGFMVTRLHRTTRTIEQSEQYAQTDFVTRELRGALRDHNREAQTYQFVVRAEPRDMAHELARLRSKVEESRRARVRDVEEARAQFGREAEEVRRETEEARRLMEKLRRELADARIERDRAIAARASDTASLRSKAEREARMRQEEVERVRRELQGALDRTSDKLDEVYESETWKIGRALLWPARVLTGRGRRRRRTARGRSTGTSDDGKSRRRNTRLLRPRRRLVEDVEARHRYEGELARRVFDDVNATHVVVTVSTRDLDAGRGDLYTAIGLGLALRELGYQCIYATAGQWYDLPEGTDMVLSLLAEAKLMLNPLRMPEDCRLVAWIRNNTQRWVTSQGLDLYDAVLCSSEATEREIANVFHGPTGVLRIGVDEQLFVAGTGKRRGVATTVNQWGRERGTYAALRQMRIDFPLAIYGVQREFHEELEPHRRGNVSYFSLPSLYAQTAIVLDDQQAVNRPYGNVNSRIFESLAVGALPITDTAIGPSLGLDAVPVYDTPEQLEALITHYLERPDERDALVAELQRQVLERHTYGNRAAQLDEFLREHGVFESAGSTGLLAFQPDYRATNPYQGLLYQSLEDTRVLPVTSPADILEGPRLGDARAGVYHIHWTATILGPAKGAAEASRRCEQYLAQLDELRARGWRLIWTLHNLMPHECPYPDSERRLRQGIADRVDAVHVMCERTVDLAASYYEIPREKVHVIAHGSYTDVYPQIVDQPEARRRLALDADAPTVLFFGQVRPYKGLERLLDAFAEARDLCPDLRLLVAGSLGRFPGAADLGDRIVHASGVTATLEVVPDEEIQLYMAACDVVVLPHERVLNSGGAFLAWSFGRPVIAPRVGCLQDVVTEEVGRLFEVDGRGLVEALAETPTLASDPVRRAARAHAEDWTHRAMAGAFRELLLELEPAVASGG